MPDFNFMNSPNFGAPGGIAANQAAMLNALSAQHSLDVHAMAPAELRKTTAEAGLKEAQLRESDAAAKALSGMSVGGPTTGGAPTSLSSQLSAIAQTLIKGGATSTGLKYAQQAEIALGHETTAAKNRAQQKHAEFQAKQSELDFGERLLRGVTDQTSLDNAARDFEAQVHEPAPFAGQVYNPALIKKYQDVVLSAKDKLANDFKVEREARISADASARLAISGMMLDLKKQMVGLAKDREVRIAKGGGKVVGRPSTGETDDAFLRIEKDHPGVALGQEGLDFAQSVAFDAKVLRQKNPALTPEQALERAYTNRKKDLEITGTWSKTVKYHSSVLGKSPQDPMPLPATAADRTVGVYYNVNGKSLLWTEEGGKKGWRAQ